MKNKLKYIYLSIIATLIFVFTFTMVNTKTYAIDINTQNETIYWNWQNMDFNQSNSKINNIDLVITYYNTDYNRFEDESFNGNLQLQSLSNYTRNGKKYFELYPKFTNTQNIRYDSAYNKYYYIGSDNDYEISYIGMETNTFTTTININYTEPQNILYYNIDTTIQITQINNSNIELSTINDSEPNNYNPILEKKRRLGNDYEILENIIMTKNTLNGNNNRLKLKYNYYDVNSYQIYGWNDNEGLSKICDVSCNYSQNSLNNVLSNDTFLNNNWISQNKYDEYVETHTHTNTEYEALEEQYEDLQDQFDTLQEQYDEVYNTLKQFEMWRSYGAFTYMDYVNFYGGDIDTNYTLEELIQEQIIVGNVMEISKYFKNREITDNNSGINIVFKPNYYTINNSNIAFYDFHPTTTSGVGITLNISGQNQTYLIPITDITWDNETKRGYNLTSTYLKNYFETNNIEIAPTDYIVSIGLSNVDIYENVDYENVLVIYPIDIDSYNVGYNNGYNDGQNALQPKINQLQEQITNLNEQINSLNQEIINKQSIIEGKNGQLEQMQTRINSLQQSLTSLQQQYDTLRTNYDDLVNRYNQITGSDNDLYQMVIAIADTPIQIFKQIFNFDVLGINLSGFVTMIISLLVIIWLIKKII